MKFSLKKLVLALGLGAFVAAGPSVVVTPVQAATTQKAGKVNLKNV